MILLLQQRLMVQDAMLLIISADTITINNHRFLTGSRVTYTNGGGGNIGGLTNGTVYFAIKVDHNTIQLATNASNARSGTALILQELELVHHIH